MWFLSKQLLLNLLSVAKRGLKRRDRKTGRKKRYGKERERKRTKNEKHLKKKDRRNPRRTIKEKDFTESTRVHWEWEISSGSIHLLFILETIFVNWCGQRQTERLFWDAMHCISYPHRQGDQWAEKKSVSDEDEESLITSLSPSHRNASLSSSDLLRDQSTSRKMRKDERHACIIIITIASGVNSGREKEW